MQQLWPPPPTYTLMAHLQASRKDLFVHWDKSVRRVDSLFSMCYTEYHIGRREPV